MASGGEVGGAEDYTAQGLSNYICSTCSKNNKSTEATHYCPECNVCYCKPCLCDHDVIGRARIHLWGKPQAVNPSPEQGKYVKSVTSESKKNCFRHPDLNVEFYCEKDDVVCCRMCLPTYHRNCSTQRLVSRIIEDKEITDNLRNNCKLVNDLICSLTYSKRENELRHHTTDLSHKQCLTQLEDIRKKVNERFDEISKRISEENEDILMKIESDQILCSRIQENISEIQETVQESDTTLTRFIKMKKCKEMANDNRRLLDDIRNTKFERYFELKTTSTEEEVLVKVEILGEIKTGRLRYSVRMSEDEKECEIEGICQLGDGKIVVSDTANKRLKVLDDKMTVVSSYDFTNTPRGVTAINETDVAVGMNDQTVEIVHVAENTELVRTLKLDRDCTNIAFSNNLLHIASKYQCGNRKNCSCKIIIHKYNLLTGDTEGVCDTDCNPGHSSGTTLYPLAFNMDGSHMYICHGYYCSVFDNDWKKIGDFFNYQFCDICFNEPDNVYIGDGSGVHKINVKDISKITQTEVTCTSDGIPSSLSIAWNKTVGRLVVGGKCDCLYMV